MAFTQLSMNIVKDLALWHPHDTVRMNDWFVPRQWYNRICGPCFSYRSIILMNDNSSGLDLPRDHDALFRINNIHEAVLYRVRWKMIGVTDDGEHCLYLKFWEPCGLKNAPRSYLLVIDITEDGLFVRIIAQLLLDLVPREKWHPF